MLLQKHGQHEPASLLTILPIVEMSIVAHSLPIQMQALHSQVYKHVMLKAHLRDLVQEGRVGPDTKPDIVHTFVGFFHVLTLIL